MRLSRGKKWTKIYLPIIFKKKGYTTIYVTDYYLSQDDNRLDLAITSMKLGIK